MTEQLFKVLDENGCPFHGGDGKWHLPQNGQPGAWMPPVKGELLPCANGYHLCRRGDLVRWLGPTIWTAEYRGDRVDDDDKIIVREARLLHRLNNWNERTARLFACDCAEHVLHLCNDDEHSQRAIDVAQHYAHNEATHEEVATARDAAWAAARAAAYAAAWAAARAAARATARDAAYAAARAAEEEWQTERLFSYLVVRVQL